MLFGNPIALDLQSPPDDVFGCVGIEVHTDGSVYPLAAVDMEQAMAEMDPFQSRLLTPLTDVFVRLWS